MKKVIIMPGKYIIGNGVINETGNYIKMIASKPMIVWGKRTREAIRTEIESSLAENSIKFEEIIFSGECTKDEAEKILKAAKSFGCDMVLAIGGGKVIDVSKASAAMGNLTTMVIPSIASNDAPTSAVTVWYNDEGECTGFDFWKKNPDIVLVDTQIIANAPVRYLIAGIGDALATWPEARAAFSTRSLAVSGGVATYAALNLAKLSFDLLIEYSKEAIRAVENQLVTPALEKVVEAATLLSGIGFESGGLACAHSVANFLPIFHETHEFLHGEKVAFGIVTQLCLEEDLSTEEIYKILDFMIDVGLPVTFDDLNMQTISVERMREFGKIAASPDSFVHNYPFKVTEETIADAMFAADALGRSRKKERGLT